jgi:hypothetical protein
MTLAATIARSVHAAVATHATAQRSDQNGGLRGREGGGGHGSPPVVSPARHCQASGVAARPRLTRVLLPAFRLRPNEDQYPAASRTGAEHTPAPIPPTHPPTHQLTTKPTTETVLSCFATPARLRACLRACCLPACRLSVANARTHARCPHIRTNERTNECTHARAHTRYPLPATRCACLLTCWQAKQRELLRARQAKEDAALARRMQKQLQERELAEAVALRAKQDVLEKRRHEAEALRRVEEAQRCAGDGGGAAAAAAAVCVCGAGTCGAAACGAS